MMQYRIRFVDKSDRSFMFSTAARMMDPSTFGNLLRVLEGAVRGFEVEIH